MTDRPEPTVRRIIPITQDGRHADPAPQGGPFKPQPASRPQNPGLSGPLGQNRIPADGGTIQYREWTGGGWTAWRRLTEADVELRIVERSDRL